MDLPNASYYIADSGDGRIRKVYMPNSIISTVAEGGPGECSAVENSIGDGDGGSATKAALCYPFVVGIFFWNLYIADTGDNRIRVVNPYQPDHYHCCRHRWQRLFR